MIKFYVEIKIKRKREREVFFVQRTLDTCSPRRYSAWYSLWKVQLLTFDITTFSFLNTDTINPQNWFPTFHDDRNKDIVFSYRYCNGNVEFVWRTFCKNIYWNNHFLDCSILYYTYHYNIYYYACTKRHYVKIFILK